MENFTVGQEAWAVDISWSSSQIEKVRIVKISKKQIQLKIWDRHSNDFGYTRTITGPDLESIFESEFQARFFLAKKKNDKAFELEQKAAELRDEAAVLRNR